MPEGLVLEIGTHIHGLKDGHLMSVPPWLCLDVCASMSFTLPFIFKMQVLPLSLLGAQDGDMLQVPLAIFV